jgi:hypothetical protein
LFLFLIKLPPMKLYWGGGGASMCTYPQHWMKVSGQLHALDCSFLGKSPWHPLDSMLGGPQSRTGYRGEEKNLVTFRELLTFPWTQPRLHTACRTFSFMWLLIELMVSRISFVLLQYIIPLFFPGSSTQCHMVASYC